MDSNYLELFGEKVFVTEEDFSVNFFFTNTDQMAFETYTLDDLVSNPDTIDDTLKIEIY